MGTTKTSSEAASQGSDHSQGSAQGATRVTKESLATKNSGSSGSGSSGSGSSGSGSSGSGSSSNAVDKSNGGEHVSSNAGSSNTSGNISSDVGRVTALPAVTSFNAAKANEDLGLSSREKETEDSRTMAKVELGPSSKDKAIGSAENVKPKTKAEAKNPDLAYSGMAALDTFNKNFESTPGITDNSAYRPTRNASRSEVITNAERMHHPASTLEADRRRAPKITPVTSRQQIANDWSNARTSTLREIHSDAEQNVAAAKDNTNVDKEIHTADNLEPRNLALAAEAGKNDQDNPVGRGSRIYCKLAVSNERGINDIQASAEAVAMQILADPQASFAQYFFTEADKLVQQDTVDENKPDNEKFTYDPNQCANKEYLIEILPKVFHDQQVMFTKYPSTNEPSTRAVNLYIDKTGNLVRQHPLAFGIANDDADGDEVAVRFDPPQAHAFGRTTDYLLSPTSGRINVKVMLWPRTSWGKDVAETREWLEVILQENNIEVAGRGKEDNLNRLSKSLYDSSSLNNPDDDTFELCIEEVLYTVAHMANEGAFVHADTQQAYQDYGAATSDVLCTIWNYVKSAGNFDSTVYSYTDQSSWPFYQDASISEEEKQVIVDDWNSIAEEFRNREYTGNLFEATLPANLRDLMVDVSASLASGGSTNATFRNMASVMNLAKRLEKEALAPGVHSSDLNWVSAQYLYSIIANYKLLEAEGSVQFKSDIYKAVLHEVGYPPQKLSLEERNILYENYVKSHKSKVAYGSTPDMDEFDKKVTEEYDNRYFRNWLTRFAEVWNYYCSVYSESTYVKTTGGTFEQYNPMKDREIKFSTPDSNGVSEVIINNKLINAFRDVYGDVPVNRLFDDSHIQKMYFNEQSDNKVPILPNDWAEMSWADFIANSNYVYEDNLGEGSSGPKFHSTFDKFILRSLNSRRWIADHLYEHLHFAFDKLLKKKNLTFNDGIDFLMELSPKVCLSLGITTANAKSIPMVAAFFDEKNRTEENMYSCFMAIQTAYKMQDVFRAEQAVKNGTASQDRVLDELQRLSYCSALWHALVNDYKNNGDAIAMLMDTSVSFLDKQNMCTELLANARTQDTITESEVICQLVDDSRGPYGENSYPGDINDLSKRADKLATKWDKTDNNMRKQAKEVRDYVKAHTGSLSQFFRQIATGSTSLTHINNHLIADVVGEAAFPDEEVRNKSGNSAATTTLAAAVMNQKYYGFWSDWTVLHGFFEGVVSKKDLQRNPGLCAYLIVNPDAQFTVVDGLKETTIDWTDIFHLSSKNDHIRLNKYNTPDQPLFEEGWLNVFDEFPQILMAFRPTTVLPTLQDESARTAVGKTQTKAMGTVAESIKYSDETTALIDHLAQYPGFAAMVSLSTDIAGRTPAQFRDEVAQSVTDVSLFIRHAAKDCKELDRAPAEYVEELFDGLEAELIDIYGSKEERSIRYQISADPTDYVDFNDDVAKSTNDLLIGDLTRFVEDCLHCGLEMSDYEYSQVRDNDVSFNLHYETKQNLNNYYATYSNATSAKIGLSIPVNGNAENTYRCLSFLAGMSPAHDCGNHETVPVQVRDLIDGSYDGARLEDGTVIDHYNLDKILQQTHSWNDTINIVRAECCTADRPCEFHQSQQVSALNRIQRGIKKGASALGRWLLHLRDDSAEGHGLKVKQQGDDYRPIDKLPNDLLDSKRKNNLHALVQETFLLDGLPGARRCYAQQMVEFHKELEYEDLSENDWVNIAQYCIHQNSNGDCIVLSLEQLAEIANQVCSRLDIQSHGKATPEQHYQVIMNAISEVAEAHSIQRNPDGSLIDNVDKEHQLNHDDLFSGINVLGSTKMGYQGVSAVGSSQPANSQAINYYYQGTPGVDNYSTSHTPRWDHYIDFYRKEYGDFLTLYQNASILPKKISEQFLEEAWKEEVVDPRTGTTKNKWHKGTYYKQWNSRTGKMEEKWASRSGRFAQFLRTSENFSGVLSVFNDTVSDRDFGKQEVTRPNLKVAPQPGSRNVVLVDIDSLVEYTKTHPEFDMYQAIIDTADLCENFGMTLRIPLESQPISRDHEITTQEQAEIDRRNQKIIDTLNTKGNLGQAGVINSGGTEVKKRVPSAKWLNIDFFDLYMTSPQSLEMNTEEFSAGVGVLPDEALTGVFLLPGNPFGDTDASGTLTQQGMDHLGNVEKTGSFSLNPKGMFIACRDRFDRFSSTAIDTTVPVEDIQEIIYKWFDEDEYEIAFDTTMSRAELSSRMQRFRDRVLDGDFNNDLEVIDQNVDNRDIIGFAKCYLDGYVVYHPIQFENPQGTDLPVGASITDVGVNHNGQLKIDWASSARLDNQVVKLHQWDFAANKATMRGDKSVSAYLSCGLPVDMLSPAFNFIPRAGIENVYEDMSTFMGVRRQYNGGYNAALNIDGFLPNDEATRVEIAMGTLSMEDWRTLLEDQINWFGEDEAELNAWLTQICQRLVRHQINPLDFLSSGFATDLETEELLRTYHWYDWSYGWGDANTLESFMDNFLRFFHKIDDTFCPDGRSDTSDPDKYIFDTNFMVKAAIKYNNKWMYVRGHYRYGPHIFPETSTGRSGAEKIQNGVRRDIAFAAMASSNVANSNKIEYAHLIASGSSMYFDPATVDSGPTMEIQ